jgi:hypothetical protein
MPPTGEAIEKETRSARMKTSGRFVSGPILNCFPATLLRGPQNETGSDMAIISQNRCQDNG